MRVPFEYIQLAIVIMVIIAAYVETGNGVTTTSILTPCRLNFPFSCLLSESLFQHLHPYLRIAINGYQELYGFKTLSLKDHQLGEKYTGEEARPVLSLFILTTLPEYFLLNLLLTRTIHWAIFSILRTKHMIHIKPGIL